MFFEAKISAQDTTRCFRKNSSIFRIGRILGKDQHCLFTHSSSFGFALFGIATAQKFSPQDSVNFVSLTCSNFVSLLCGLPLFLLPNCVFSHNYKLGYLGNSINIDSLQIIASLSFLICRLLVFSYSRIELGVETL